ncbi:MAG: hypothetical protein GY722_23425 [bacterium]|nr:hypothetical protein [bacterium]
MRCSRQQKVRPGSIDGVAALFDKTNRDLVAGHQDWLGAWFTASRENSEVTVIARWNDADSYESPRSSGYLLAAMAQFAEQFAGPPTVSVSDVLVEMWPDWWTSPHIVSVRT